MILVLDIFRKCWYGLGRVAENYKTKMSKNYETDFLRGWAWTGSQNSYQMKQVLSLIQDEVFKEFAFKGERHIFEIIQNNM